MTLFLQSFIDPKKKIRDSSPDRPNASVIMVIETLIVSFSMALISNFVPWRLILGCVTMLGLQFDLYDSYYDIDVKEALNRLPKEVVDVGNQHLKRAMDLSMKHQYLPDDL
ncbi:cytochrome b-c1 complex subunit 7-like [Benincasa hispida]|uniref:cytochrome b-c1 complex subunit 7-like n=1 Tax=Benincasa hispida TaxID=102211 RepID=UPI0018FF4EBC|nr:cytochrome b-c1 complex subunit 7-like [Benincasa hispida]